MTSAPTISDFTTAARIAMAAFGLDVADIAPLSHSENVVLALTTTNDKRFAIRLHRPGYNSIAEMNSEVQFVESLRRFGVPVPTATPLTAGGHYTPVDVAGIEHQVGVVEWVRGEPLGGPLDAGGPSLVSHYRRIGELAAQIRLHNQSWQAPAGFTRRRWDAAGLVGEAPSWGRFWEVDLLTDAQRSVFSQARDRLIGVLDAIPLDDNHFGLIHSDLHLGNVMADGTDLTIIDFDDSGYGYFVHELAVALHPMVGEDDFDAALDSLVEGYRSVYPLPDADVALIADFLAMRSLMIIGWLAARPEVPAYAQWAEVASDVEAHITDYLAVS